MGTAVVQPKLLSWLRREQVSFFPHISAEDVERIAETNTPEGQGHPERRQACRRPKTRPARHPRPDRRGDRAVITMGVRTLVTADILGHSTVAMVARYSHPDLTMMR